MTDSHQEHVAAGNATTAAFAFVHASPFTHLQDLPDLPRIPDGSNKPSQIGQIKIQGSLQGDSTGQFHIVIPGDPFQQPFPILSSNSNVTVNLNSTDLFLKPPTLVPNGGSISVPFGIGSDTTMSGINNLIQACYNDVESMLPTFHTQLWAFENSVSEYRIVAQGFRVWSIQGYNNQQGILRVAPIDNELWKVNTRTRGPIGFSAAANAATPTPVRLNQWDSYSGLTGFIKTMEATSPANISSLDDAPNAGLIYAMMQGASVWKQYLAQVAQSSEPAYSYHIYQGQSGASARSAYAHSHAPIEFMNMEPSHLAMPPNPRAIYPEGTLVSWNRDGVVVNVNNQASNPQYSMNIAIQDVHQVTDSENTVLTQSRIFGGQEVGKELSWGAPIKQASNQRIHGFHIIGNNWPTATSGGPVTMYCEYTLTLEYVRAQQTTGIMDKVPMEDINIHHILRALNDRRLFPVVVTGHSFWSTLKHIFHKVGQFAGFVIKHATIVGKVASAAGAVL